jgi:hypothetical protein
MQIYYFSKTGRSEKVAKELAARYGTEARKVDDGQTWKGLFGFLKGGYMATYRKTLPVKYQAPQEGEPIALVFPIWAGAFPPGVRMFINEIGRDRLIVLPTSGSSLLKDREGFARIIDLPGPEIAVPESLE